MPPSTDPFEVFPFSLGQLVTLLARQTGTPSAYVEEKSHLDYFDEYFTTLNAVTILVENRYIDHDFLDDYAAYYAKCFHPYDRFCSRLHFFTTSFKAEDFSALLQGREQAVSAKSLQAAYLGFIVVKPLPQTFIGRTCLHTYSPEGRRYYPTTRTYHAHLFGIHLSVKAVAFQEQDTVVAMCATSALWSVFHGTGALFHHSILSPVEITQAATLNSDDPMRSLPNDGLTQEQMARAIRAVGLEPYFVKVGDRHVLTSTVYAYLRGKIPVLLDVRLVDVAGGDGEVEGPEEDDEPGETTDGSETEEDDYLTGKSMGLHEVAVVGYSLGSTPVPLTETGLLLTASRIDKLYAHDDQVGPYARMEVEERGFLRTSWPSDASGDTGDVWADPGNLLVPLYNKIRIPFSIIHDAILSLDQVLEELRTNGTSNYPARFEWDIYLTTSNDLKTELFQDSALNAVQREQVLLEHLPRFLWRATAICEGQKKIDLLFDATDIEQGKLFVRPVEYDADLSDVLRGLSQDSSFMESVRLERTFCILEWFAK